MLSKLSALEHLGLHHIVHRDIKPENILLCPKDPSRVRLIDFGLAQYLPECDLSPPQKQDGKHVVGTLNWASIYLHEGFGMCFSIECRDSRSS